MSTDMLCAHTYPNMYTHMQTDTPKHVHTQKTGTHTQHVQTQTHRDRQTEEQSRVSSYWSLYSLEKLTGLEERFYTLGSVVIDMHTKLPHCDIAMHI